MSERATTAHERTTERKQNAIEAKQMSEISENSETNKEIYFNWASVYMTQ